MSPLCLYSVIIDRNIENLVQTRAQLKTTRMEAEQMNELAHKDALTGLGNKLAYDKALQLLNLEKMYEQKKQMKASRKDGV